MNLKRITTFILVFALALTSASVFAESSSVPLPAKFTSEPTPEHIKIMNENRKEKVVESPSLFEITPEGYQRVYGDTVFSKVTTSNKYNFIGQASAYNGTSSSAPLQYTQGATKTTSWNVSASVKGSKDIEAKFLANVSLEVGFGVGRSTTTAQSSTVTFTIQVPSKKTGYIDAYHKAGYANGYIKWYDYTPTGNLVRSGTTTVSGYGIGSGVHYDGYTK